MGNLEERKSKINKCMAELFNIYMIDRKPITSNIKIDGIEYTLTFDKSCVKEEPKNEGKNKFTIKDLDGVVIHCETEQEAEDCCKLADELGLDWSDGDDSTCITLWEVYEDKTCYNFYDSYYSSLQFYTEEKYEIKPAKWFLDNFNKLVK